MTYRTILTTLLLIYSTIMFPNNHIAPSLPPLRGGQGCALSLPFGGGPGWGLSSWRFSHGDIPGAELPAYDDSAWQEVCVPHDFQIAQPWVAPDTGETADHSDAGSNVASKLSARGFKAMGIGWYRQWIDIPEELKGKRLTLDFEGIMYYGDVFVNGKRVGGTDYGYVGFEVDITNSVSYGGRNLIAVKADTGRPDNSRWYTGGGLFRNVSIHVTDANLYLARHPLYITTDAKASQVCLQVETVCRTKQDSISLNVQIIDPKGTTVYNRRHDLRRHRAMRSEELQLPAINIPDAQLWDCDTPNLYTAKVTLMNQNGDVVDEAAEQFGIRTIEYSPEYGFKLNGRKVLLQGIANHHTLGALGAAAYEAAMEKRIVMLKQFGINHIRTSHNPYSESFLRLCDKHGILVVDELYDKWLDKFCGRGTFTSLWQTDLPEFVKRDRNHPCVVMWSMGNELQQYSTLPHNDFGVTQYRLMRQLLHRYDDTRPSTVAMHPRYRSLDTDSLPCNLARETDIAAYNYRYMYFPGDGRRFPNMMFYQSEASVAAMGPNFFDMDRSKVIGLAYWGLIDYLGESAGWPAKGWAQGVFDISLEPKPKAYLMQSFFRPEQPVAHIAIRGNEQHKMWNGIDVGNAPETDYWSRTNGDVQDVCVYTNAEEVELRLNGRLIARKKNNVDDSKQRNQVLFPGVCYADGRLTAIARNGGKEVARHEIATAGKAVALKLCVEPSADGVWNADGEDLLHVRIYAVDSRGRRVYDADGEVTVSAPGLVALCSGNINSNELFTDSHVPLYNGSALAIIRASTTPGSITITAKSPGLKSARISVPK